MPDDAAPQPLPPGHVSAEHRAIVVARFRRLGLDLHDAEDCAQDTFLRFERARPGYRPAAPLSAFLLRIAHSVYVDWCRRQRVRRVVRQAAPEDRLERLPSAETLAPGEALDVGRAVEALPEHLRVVVELTVRRGLGYREAGERLGIPVGTVKSRMFHAVRRLRAALGGEDPS